MSRDSISLLQTLGHRTFGILGCEQESENLTKLSYFDNLYRMCWFLNQKCIFVKRFIKKECKSFEIEPFKNEIMDALKFYKVEILGHVWPKMNLVFCF